MTEHHRFLHRLLSQGDIEYNDNTTKKDSHSLCALSKFSSITITILAFLGSVQQSLDKTTRSSFAYQSLLNQSSCSHTELLRLPVSNDIAHTAPIDPPLELPGGTNICRLDALKTDESSGSASSHRVSIVNYLILDHRCHRLGWPSVPPVFAMTFGESFLTESVRTLGELMGKISEP